MRAAWVVFLLAAAAAAQEIGEAAPAIAADGGWLNAPQGEQPSLDAFRGKAVLIEFWDTG